MNPFSHLNLSLAGLASCVASSLGLVSFPDPPPVEGGSGNETTLGLSHLQFLITYTMQKGLLYVPLKVFSQCSHEGQITYCSGSGDSFGLWKGDSSDISGRSESLDKKWSKRGLYAPNSCNSLKQ